MKHSEQMVVRNFFPAVSGSKLMTPAEREILSLTLSSALWSGESDVPIKAAHQSTGHNGQNENVDPTLCREGAAETPKPGQREWEDSPT